MTIVLTLHHAPPCCFNSSAILPALLPTFNLSKNSSLHPHPFPPSLPVFCGFTSKPIVNHRTYHVNCFLTNISYFLASSFIIFLYLPVSPQSRSPSFWFTHGLWPCSDYMGARQAALQACFCLMSCLISTASPLDLYSLCAPLQYLAPQDQEATPVSYQWPKKLSLAFSSFMPHCWSVSSLSSFSLLYYSSHPFSPFIHLRNT